MRGIGWFFHRPGATKTKPSRCTHRHGQTGRPAETDATRAYPYRRALLINEKPESDTLLERDMFGLTQGRQPKTRSTLCREANSHPRLTRKGASTSDDQALGRRGALLFVAAADPLAWPVAGRCSSCPSG